MKKVKTKRLKFLKGEKIMYILLLLLVLAIPICNVFTQAKLSESNIAVSRLKSKIETQEKVNESLNMQINDIMGIMKYCKNDKKKKKQPQKHLYTKILD